ncbi:MAG: Lrp/AsnC family transcriptional regulator [Nanoarchaeota archaeon]|nr:Lrp/AsnC family transcriptional regulator [Nanoarchaeota archaeon]
MDDKDRLFLAYLRNNARMNLTTLSKKTGIPISTLYDRLKAGERSVIIKHTTLLDFGSIGYGCRANIIFKIEREAREAVRLYLSKHTSVNSLFKINNGYDYMIEAIFRNIRELEDFLELVDDKFKVLDKHVHYIIEEITRENFLTDTNVNMDVAA